MTQQAPLAGQTSPTRATPHHVVHYTTAEVPAGPIHGQIDWPRRLDHMQQHTAQHLLSAAFIELFGFQTVSFHLGKEISTIDLAAPSVVPRQIEAAERRTNEIIFEDRPVVIRFGTAQELAESGIRKKVDREGILRAIEIQGFDRQPCGGTHLASTGQAGLILLRKLERTREHSRIEFLAGYRALAAARAEFATLTQAAAQLSCALAEVPASIAKNIEDRRANNTAIKRLEERLASSRSGSFVAGSSGIIRRSAPHRRNSTRRHPRIPRAVRRQARRREKRNRVTRSAAKPATS